MNRVRTIWYYNNDKINDIDSFIKKLSDEELDSVIYIISNNLHNYNKENKKMNIKDLGSTLFMCAGNALMIASLFNDGSIKNMLFGLGLATFIPAFIGNLKLSSKQKRNQNENIIPTKEFLEKLNKEKSDRQYAKEIYPDLF